jgi:hypothetical protein
MWDVAVANVAMPPTRCRWAMHGPVHRCLRRSPSACLCDGNYRFLVVSGKEPETSQPRNGLHESTTGKWQVAKPNRKESPRTNCAANAAITRSPDGTVSRDRREPPNYLSKGSCPGFRAACSAHSDFTLPGISGPTWLHRCVLPMLATIHSTQDDPDHDTPEGGVLYTATAVNMIVIGNVYTLSSFVHTGASCRD